MVLQISTDEFRIASQRLRALAADIETWCGRSGEFGVLAQVSPVRREVARLEEVAARLELVARKYDDGEINRMREFDGLARASLSVLAAVMPAVYAQLVLAGVLASNTRSGVALDAALAATVPLAPLVDVAKVTGFLKQQPVFVSGSPPGSCAPPQGYAELLSRIPRSQAQVRIERLGTGMGMGTVVGTAAGTSTGSGSDAGRVIVYIAGTKDFGLTPGREPWDMASNALALSGSAMADSERAVREALRQAGVDANAPLMLVGHSQGGLIAARLAASGEFNVTDVVTAGAPSRGVSIPESIRVTTIEHTNDVIPALSSAAPVGVATGAASAGALRIRETLAEGAPTTRLPAHVLSGYINTARRMDESTDPLVRRRRAELTTVPNAQAKCSATEYTAVRSAPHASKN